MDQRVGSTGRAGAEAGGNDLTLAPSEALKVTLPAGGHPAAKLLYGSPAEVHARITAGDPLRVQERISFRRNELAFLIDADRVCSRALTRVATAAPEYEGDPLGGWLVARIDESVADLLRADHQLLRDGAPGVEDWDPRFAFLTHEFAVQVHDTLAASVRFNALPSVFRQSVFALVIQNRPIDEVAGKALGTREEVVYRACYGLEILLFGDVEVAERQAAARATKEAEE